LWRALFATQWAPERQLDSPPPPPSGRAAQWRTAFAARYALSAALQSLLDRPDPDLGGVEASEPAARQFFGETVEGGAAAEAAAGPCGPAWALAELQRRLRAGASGEALRLALLHWQVRAAVRLARACRQLPPNSAGAATAAALLLDAGCLLSLMVDPTADLDAVREEVAALGARCADRLAAEGLGPGAASNSARLARLTQLLFAPGAAYNGLGGAGPMPLPPVGQAGGMDFSGDSDSYCAAPTPSNPPRPVPARLAGCAAAGHASRPPRRGPAMPAPLCCRTMRRRRAESRAEPLRRRAAPAADACRNCSLAALLHTRRGLPITLSVLHVAVGAAAGVRVVPVSAPMHFVTGVCARWPRGAPPPPPPPSSPPSRLFSPGGGSPDARAVCRRARRAPGLCAAGEAQPRPQKTGTAGAAAYAWRAHASP